MSKLELQQKLDTFGIEYDKRWGEKKLQALVDSKVEKNVIEAVTTEAPTTDDILDSTKRTKDGAETKSGLIIPFSALKNMEKTRYVHVARSTSTEVEIYKVDRQKKEKYVRTYSKEVHGKDFMQLAEAFLKKVNS